MNLNLLKMPESVVIDESSYSNSFGRFTIQPLERGFAVTIGNSLRRVLLSSLPGAAITAIKIDGILHEFSTVPGVREDVTEIILNLKQVRLKLLNKKPVKFDVKLSGPMEFKASDLSKFSNEIEVLNPELKIATLNSSANLSMEIRVGYGKGYVTSGEQVFQDKTIGLIPIDSIFTPIKNVKYEIENVRIGDRNDFEKLVLEITTDGSITPEDALTQSAKILNDHLRLFINYDTEPVEQKQTKEEDLEKERIKKILMTNVEELELSVRAYNCLKSANIKTLADLVRRQESEMLKFRNFGRKSLSELTAKIESFGLHFGFDVDKYLNEKSDNN
jgi:DNA-directed RNA polymerase subunit alpha